MNGFPYNFFNCRDFVAHLPQAAAPQSDHAVGDGDLFQFHRSCARYDGVLDWQTDFHHLVKAHTALVSRTIADLASGASKDAQRIDFFRLEAKLYQGRMGWGLGLLFAVLADFADEPLRANQLYGSRDQ